MFNDKTYSQKMDKTIEVFQKELTSLRTGRANASMLDLVKVDVYGQPMPLNQISSITTPDARTINIQVWDLNNVPLVDTAIKKSELGLNPQIDGQLIRLPVPDLNEERRTEIKKLIKSMTDLVPVDSLPCICVQIKIFFLPLPGKIQWQKRRSVSRFKKAVFCRQ